MRKGTLLLWAVLGACLEEDPGFRCRESSACSYRGQAGRCEKSGLCSFADEACPSARRYGEFAGSARSHRCVEESMCGDAKLNLGEECDDGNLDDRDGCTSRCLSCVAPPTGAAFALPTTGACYIRHSEALAWGSASARCVAESGNLVTFASLYEFESVSAALLPAAAGPWPLHWIGLSDLRAEGNYTWVTGEPVSLQSWQPPGSPQRELDCAALSSDLVTRLDIVSTRQQSCARPLPFICKKVPWIEDGATGHRYRLIAQHLKWADAREACTRLDAHLAVVTSRAENTFLTSTFVGTFWLGASDEAKEGDFVWITHDPFEFRSFAPNEPDDFPPTQDCLVIAEDRLWHDRPCGLTENALCERD